MARYRVNQDWPAVGIVVAKGTVVDDSVWQNFKGIVPPWHSTPLDETTRQWMAEAYRFHPFTIPPVEAE